LDSLVLTGISSVFDRIIQVLFSLLGVYLFWFVVTAEQEGGPVLTVNSIEFNNEGAKAREFFRSAWNVNNFWMIPVESGYQELGGTGDLNE
jgi:hypothetical protein